jgi:hypothetical protein
MIDEGLLTDLLDLMIIGDLNFSACLKSFIIEGCDGAGVNASDFHFDIPGSNPALVKDIF